MVLPILVVLVLLVGLAAGDVSTECVSGGCEVDEAPLLQTISHARGGVIGYFRSVADIPSSVTGPTVVFNGHDDVSGIMDNMACAMPGSVNFFKDNKGEVYIDIGGGTGTPWSANAKAYASAKTIAGYIAKGSYKPSGYCKGSPTPTVDLSAVVGICYDIEAAADAGALAASLKEIKGMKNSKNEPLKTLVTVAHSGLTAGASAMESIVKSTDIDIFSPQLYGADGKTFAFNDDLGKGWAYFNDMKAKFMPVIPSDKTQSDIEGKLTGLSRNIDGVLLWPPGR
jgi:hypothetical protein